MKTGSFAKYVGLLAFLILGSTAIQPDNGVFGQENTDQRRVQKRISDDLADNLAAPIFIDQCFDKNKLDRKIKIPSMPLHNPYFLRGDFDGDRNIDYAVIVESRKDKREGLLVCFRNRETQAVLLGLDSQDPPPFWLLMNWDVETSAEVSKITDVEGRSVGIRPKGESIVMKGEDWIGILYWNGKTFAWKKVILNAGNSRWSSMQLGKGRRESTQFNSRLQPMQTALGTTQNATDLLKLEYGYGTTANNGNVLS